MKVRIVSIPQANNGLQVENNQFTPISDNMVMLNGNTHEDGGTDISYNGQQVEAEKGEPVSIGNNGEAIVWGNMNIPGTSKKFKGVAKRLGEQEERYSKIGDKASFLLSNSSPDEKFSRLTFNSGKIMQLGSVYGQKDIDQKREQLAGLQKALLQVAGENNLDPQALSKGKIKRAKKGAYIPYAADGDTLGPGDGTRADRNNNPGNIKYVKGAKWMGPGVTSDPDGFAIFPTKEQGLAAMKQQLKRPLYNNLTPEAAINKWTAGKPYNYTLPDDIKGKKISELSDDQLSILTGIMSQGEGTKYGVTPVNTSTPAKNISIPGNINPYKPVPYTFTPTELPNIGPLTPESAPNTPQGVNPPPLQGINPSTRPNIPSNAQALDLKQILPEIYGFATNRVEPVPLQKYTPQLYTPYQVSFQDQLNDNQSTFNALSRRLDSNPSAISSIAAQKYSADNAVRANEFRTNQGIQADVINKNIGINNQAQLQNLQLADTQTVRQSQARSRTKEINQAIMNSISNKYLQNNLQNRQLQAYENLYDYRFTPNGQAEYMGPDAQFNYNGTPTGGASSAARQVVERNPSGDVIKTREVTPSMQDQQSKDLLNQQRKRKLSLLSNFYNEFGK
jgi:hypothetical protein